MAETISNGRFKRLEWVTRKIDAGELTIEIHGRQRRRPWISSPIQIHSRRFMKINRLVLGCAVIASAVATVSVYVNKSAVLSSSGHASRSQSAREKRSWNPERSPQSPQRTAQRALQDDILGLLSSGNPFDQNKVYHELVPTLVKIDPCAAAAFARSAEVSPWRENMMMVVAQNWANLDPDEAQDWASHLSNPADNPHERDNMVSYVAFAVASTDVKRAVQVLEEVPINGTRREILIENLAQQWAESDLQPLAKWIATLPPGEERDGYFARIANAQARTDPSSASTIVSRNISPGPIQEEAALNVLRQWAWNDRSAAADWVNQFPEGEMRDRAARELAEAIARRGAN
jgi:hypothetical protein